MITNKDYQKSLLIILVFLLIFESILILISGLDRPYWGDEVHFVRTIKEFGQGITLDRLKHYNEMSTPLPFIVYALWGRLWGFEIENLRVLSLLIATITYLLFHFLVFNIFRNSKTAFWLTVFLIIQPYMIGLSFFVFTDMLTMLFLLLGLLALIKQNPWLWTLSSAGGLLCRQYFIFFTLAAGIYFTTKLLVEKDKSTSKMIISTTLSLIPLLILILLWKGLSPENSRKELYLKDGLFFHPEYLTLYICLFFVYLFPIILQNWKNYYSHLKLLIIFLFISGIYFIFPVEASQPAKAVHVDTVGLFHRFIRLILGEKFEHIIFFIAFWLSLPVLYRILQDGYQRWQRRQLDFGLLLDLSIVLFLIIMPFSYVVWEKYFIPIIPIAALQMIWSRKYPLMNSSIPKLQI